MNNVSFCAKPQISRCKPYIPEVTDKFIKEGVEHPTVEKAEEKIAEISNEKLREATKAYYAAPFQSPGIDPRVNAAKDKMPEISNYHG